MLFRGSQKWQCYYRDTNHRRFKKGWGQLAKAEEGTSPEPASAEGEDRGRGSVDVIFNDILNSIHLEAHHTHALQPFLHTFVHSIRSTRI